MTDFLKGNSSQALFCFLTITVVGRDTCRISGINYVQNEGI